MLWLPVVLPWSLANERSLDVNITVPRMPGRPRRAALLTGLVQPLIRNPWTSSLPNSTAARRAASSQYQEEKLLQTVDCNLERTQLYQSGKLKKGAESFHLSFSCEGRRAPGQRAA